MARGGLYDQVGGGFARYSVDAEWLVPHFEKMLYDNAQLLRLGLHIVQANEATADVNDEARRVCIETLDWLRREMTAPSGGFYSTLDADSEGHEGKFYLWDESELRELLGPDANAMIEYWGVTAGGNFEGRNILTVAHDTLPRGLQSDPKQVLYDARAKRVWPAKDEKILAAWNGLMLRAVAEAARMLGRAEDRELAVRNGEFLFREMVRDGRVLRSHKNGVSKIGGFLEDHAAVALGALALYELTFERVWLDRARELAASVERWFWDGDVGAFFDTAGDAERLVTRPRDLNDNATPAGASLTVELLLRLGDLTENADMTRRANAVLETIAEPMARFPLAFGHALQAADLAVYGAVELAIVGDAKDADLGTLTRAAASVFVPSLVVAGGVKAKDIPLLRDREARGGKPTAYVCRGYSCDAPTSDPSELVEQLKSVRQPAARP